MATARLVLSARTLSRPRHVPVRTFTVSSPSRIAKPFVPPASLSALEQEVQGNDPLSDFSQRAGQRPPTPTFYTTRSDYYDVLGGLQDAINSTRATLKSLHLYPLPQFALDALPPAHPAWADRKDMGAELDVALSASMHRQLVVALKELELYHRIAKTAGITALEESLGDLISSFESTKQVEARERQLLKKAMMGKRATLDEFGRSYTLGRRKTSTARVWMIKAQDTAQPADASAETASTSVSTLLSPAAKISPPPTTSVLVNAAPISTYFPLPADREAVLRPLKLTGLLGAYNVFALVRGGGTSGQSGALALAIARACASHAPEVEPILRKGTVSGRSGSNVAHASIAANLMKRDPRMVERKKTGLAKARKAVRSLFLHDPTTLIPSSTVRLGQAVTCRVVCHVPACSDSAHAPPYVLYARTYDCILSLSWLMTILSSCPFRVPLDVGVRKRPNQLVSFRSLKFLTDLNGLCQGKNG